MRSDKELAVRLRKGGLSYKEIAAKLSISKSTLSAWFCDLPWSREIANKNKVALMLLNRDKIAKINLRRAEYLKKYYAQADAEATKEYKLYSKDKLFNVCLALYWGEGDKSLNNHLVRIANTDPSMLNLFANFLRSYCGVSSGKIKIWLLLYPELNEEACKTEWSGGVGLPLANFYKSQVIVGRAKNKRLQYGVGNIIIGNKYLKVKILRWIDLMSVELYK